MTRVCSWCGKSMGEKEPLEDKRITHGICGACEQLVLEAEHIRMGEGKEAVANRS